MARQHPGTCLHATLFLVSGPPSRSFRYAAGRFPTPNTPMKSVVKIVSLLFLIPAAVFAQAGLRMSADFLPLEVGNRWVYDVFNEGGEKVGTFDFVIQDRRIVDGR